MRASTTRHRKRKRGNTVLIALLFSSAAFCIYGVWKGIHLSNEESVFAPVLARKPTHHACDGYDGILHIASGDTGAAAGTVFFQFVVNQLLYAERYNLKPWIHLSNVSHHIFDAVVHGTSQVQSFEMLYGATISWESKSGTPKDGSWPGPPVVHDTLHPHVFTVSGTGVWNSYFDDVSDFVPGDASCRSKPLLTMHPYHLNPALHMYTPWAVRSWRYWSLPHYLTEPRDNLHEWYEPMRRRGHDIVSRYYKFRPSMVQLAQQANPYGGSCLAVHIRHSDKGGANRRRIEVDEFLPYIQAYVQATAENHRVYLATDSGRVLGYIRKRWPQPIQDTLQHQGDNVLRSNYKAAVFNNHRDRHHQTNLEVLVDILAMSQCQFFLHGFSAVSEAVLYLNLELHNRSVDLEDATSTRMSPLDFEQIVRLYHLNTTTSKPSKGT